MRRALSRLRWQLTLSHLVAISVTLVSMIAAVLLITSTWWSQTSNAAFEPVEDARVVASALEGRVLKDVAQPTGNDAELSTLLGLMASGDLRLLSGPAAGAPDAARLRAPMGSALNNIGYLVIVGADGRVLGSSDPAGAAYSPAEKAEWIPLMNAALQGASDPARLVAVRSGGSPAALGAYPIADQAGHPVAAALVAMTTLTAPNQWWDLWHALLFFGAASVVILAGASIFALASSSLVGYLLARRLVRRLERLGRAAEALAAGDLSQRVDPGASADEVGQLAERFNFMADRLSDTLAELAAEKQTVETALQAKRELVANVSHELRTPLASIQGHTESLLMRTDADRDESQRAYLNVIHRQAEQLSHLIDDLFLLSTTDNGALPLTLRPLSLVDVVQEVVSSIQPAARAERRVSLVADVSPELPVVLADRQRVAQVLSNLVRNAVRHTPEGGLVAVRAHQSASRHVTVSVEDTGDGIPPDQLEHVFERFYRGDPSRDRASGGAGLGLAIVRELVTAMGGEVAAESTPGEGSRFWFTLPLADSPASPGQPTDVKVRAPIRG